MNLNRSLKPAGFAAALTALAALATAGQSQTFSFVDKPGECLEVLLDGKIVARYLCAYDKSTPARLHETYKPYLHVFDAEGKAPITKGPGGQYTHHRGIFIGWNKLGFGGKNYDRWHMKGGEMVHQKFLDQKGGNGAASFTSLTHWNDESGQSIVEEQRTMEFRPGPAPARLLIDFTTVLKAPRGDVMLDGDPEHAGVQYRPANEVVAKETVYIFPQENADPKKDRDYPWVAETYTLNGKRHTVVHMNHPDNPKGTVYSAYRDYGRFGAFFKAPIKSGESLTLKYRFLIAEGEMPDAQMVHDAFCQFAGRAEKAPAPKLTVVGSVAKNAAKKK